MSNSIPSPPGPFSQESALQDGLTQSESDQLTTALSKVDALEKEKAALTQRVSLLEREIRFIRERTRAVMEAVPNMAPIVSEGPRPGCQYASLSLAETVSADTRTGPVAPLKLRTTRRLRGEETSSEQGLPPTKRVCVFKAQAVTNSPFVIPALPGPRAPIQKAERKIYNEFTVDRMIAVCNLYRHVEQSLRARERREHTPAEVVKALLASHTTCSQYLPTEPAEYQNYMAVLDIDHKLASVDGLFHTPLWNPTMASTRVRFAFCKDHICNALKALDQTVLAFGSDKGIPAFSSWTRWHEIYKFRHSPAFAKKWTLPLFDMDAFFQDLTQNAL
ncbi:hypothetical protein BC830DRAFT_1167319 [Chytriomyces sp. MP71]|nr:hypothetical protein BC830DRAFT_1167319 [Chytriomyces sp. MP71]